MDVKDGGPSSPCSSTPDLWKSVKKSFTSFTRGSHRTVQPLMFHQRYVVANETKV